MIAIVTDSSVCITQYEALINGLSVVPLTFTVNGHIYNETYSDRNGDFVNLIFSGNAKCQTANANIAAFMSTFSELVNKGFDVLCLTISSRLSGTYSSASIAAREVSREKITVLDSRSTAGGLYLLVKEAKNMITAGMSIDEIVKQLTAKRTKILTAFSVDDMDPLRKSGRLGIVRQSVGTILNIKPLLMCIDGAVVSDGAARGRHDQINKLVSKLPENISNVIVHYIKNSDTVSLLIREIQKKHPDIKIERRPLGPVLSIHLGLSTIGMTWMEN